MKAKLLLWLKANIKYLILFVVFVLLVSVISKCNRQKEQKQGINNLIAARDSVKQLEVTIEGLKNSIWEKNAIILGQEESIKAGIIREDLLKKLHVKNLITNAELSGIIHKQDSLLKLPPNTIFITVKDTSGITHDYVRIPFDLLKLNEKYVSLNTGMDINRKAWYYLSVPFIGNISIGYVKSGFLKTTPKGIFITENPYIKINNMDVLIVKEPDKFYNKTWFHLFSGAIIFETIHQIVKK
jgi:hypothetical protein